MSRRRSLSVQLLWDVLRSLLAGAAVFAALFLGGCRLLDQTVYGSVFSGQMADQRFARLEEYVVQEGVTPDNLRPLDIWCGRSGKVYLTLYRSDRLLYESPVAYDWEPDPEDYSPDLEDPEREYALTLADGTQTRAFLYYYAGGAYYFWTVVFAGTAAFLVFSLCFVSFVHRKMRYVQLLKGELDILSGGDLSYPITVQGRDELSELAAGIDQMRQSISAHQAAEERMRWANSQLVTAMSHDLRTPLTSLLAYLELMERGKYEDQEQLTYFIRRSLEKTLQIKSMADKLFEYFLVYSSEREPPHLEPTDGDALFGHLLGEYAFSLESRGFSVSQEIAPLGGVVQVDLQLLRRVFDNLYSNLLKYADPAVSICLSCCREGDRAYLTLSNGISPLRDKKESTNIGLNTCEKILRRHGGTFSYREDEGRFRVEITLPLASS